MARAKQYADRVNIIKRIKLGSKWPFASVVEHNGRIVRDHVWVAGREEHHPEGRYYLEWYEGGERRRKPVPKFENLLQAARSKSIELNALKAGLLLPSGAPAVQKPARITMNAAIDDYLDYIRKHRSLRIYRTYRPILSVLFRNSYTKTYVDAVSLDVVRRNSNINDLCCHSVLAPAAIGNSCFSVRCNSCIQSRSMGIEWQISGAKRSQVCSAKRILHELSRH